MYFNSSKALQLLIMQNKPRQAILFVLLLSIFIFFLINFPILAVFFAIFLILSWRNIRLSISLLIIYVFVSPKIILATNFSEAVFVRFDDLALLAISFITLIRFKKEDTYFLNSPLDRQIFSFLIVLLLSIINGIFVGSISRPLVSSLYFIKLCEYFLFFYLIYFYTKTKEDTIYYLKVCLLGQFIISSYGVFEYFHPLATLPYPALYRIYERGFFYGQSNHLGGLLAFFICLVVGLIIFTDNFRNKILLAIIVFVSIFAFYWTYSRQAQINLAVSLLTLGILSLSRISLRAKLVFFLILLIFILIALSSTLTQERIFSIKSVIFSNDINTSSFIFRLKQWEKAFSDTKNYLILGSGLGSRQRAFYESQWVMFLAETGIIGLLLYFWLIYKASKLILKVFLNTNDNLYKGLAAGYFSGLVGLFAQGFVCNVFIVTVIAAPFYVLLALILGSFRRLT